MMSFLHRKRIRFTVLAGLTASHIGRQFETISTEELAHKEDQRMFKATLQIAEEIAHDLNVRREFVWEIIQGMRYDSIEELEIRVCKAIVSH